ncbi:hypothetical protein [Microcoleus sp. herbarium14]|uniref:hypothetical protein n=1 Tax=Microcoleus sp. herbarium14 TaxID=3055439 RepID=UPI002FD0A034
MTQKSEDTTIAASIALSCQTIDNHSSAQNCSPAKSIDFAGNCILCTIARRV